MPMQGGGTEIKMKKIYIASCVPDGGIYRFSMSDNKLNRESFTPVDQPMFFAVNDNKMYVLLRDPFGNDISGMCTFDIDPDGNLTNKSETIPTKGKVACHICTCDDDVYAVNYSSGSAIHFPDTLAVHEGKGINPKRQEMPHTHFVGATPDKKYICVTDLGLDKIFFCDRNLNTCFTAAVPQGYGARHLAFSDDGQYIYCVNELVSSVTVFEYDGKSVKPRETYSALPNEFCGTNLGAAIRIYKNRLYVSNRGHNSIAVFDINDDKLELSDFIMTGDHPRDFNIADDMIFCCNMNDDTVTLYSINDSFRLIDTISVKAPLCVNFE